jgi:hypothetical protein
VALIGRYSVLSKHPGTDLGGGATGQGMNRGDFSKNSRHRARFTSTDWQSKSGVPDGYRPPSAWIWPQSPGGLSSYKSITGAGALAAAGAMGVNGTAPLTGAGDLTGTGALIVSAVANLTGVGVISAANAVAFLNAVAALSGSGSLTGDPEAIGHALAELAGIGSVTAVRYGTGTLAADITPFTELSPQSLSSAVWASTEGSFLYALAHNKVITDPSAGTMTVYDTDGTTVLYVADLFQDAAGATAYAGAGAERRDAFA